MVAPEAAAKETILVVDDEPGMRELLVVLFTKNGYNAVAVRDVSEALDLAARFDPAVAVVDYRVSGGGGIELIRRMRDCLPDTRCIFMTAYDDPLYFREAVQAGACDTIRKPFDLVHLLAKVREQVRLRLEARLEARQGGEPVA
ncbi:MAG: response regulator [Firmicutes bacterium]|nr:response regulator [Bacillota bacterium]